MYKKESCLPSSDLVVSVILWLSSGFVGCFLWYCFHRSDLMLPTVSEDILTGIVYGPLTIFVVVLLGVADILHHFLIWFLQ